MPTGGYTFTLKGDNKALANNPNASSADVGTQVINTDLNGVNYIIGKVTAKSVVIGYVVYAIKQPLGMALLIIIPSAVILVLEIIKIVGILGSDKKQKAKEEKEKQENEIEALKRQLEELKKQNAENISNE